MARFSSASMRFISLLAIGFALFISGAAAAQAPGYAAGVPAPGTARVWFYRVFFPDDTGDMPAVAMNGNVVGYARAGYAFFRDVPAGAYHLSVASTGVDVNQSKDVVLTPGEQIYVSIQSNPTWETTFRGYRRGTYYVWFEPPQIAAIHMSQSRLSNGT